MGRHDLQEPRDNADTKTIFRFITTEKPTSVKFIMMITTLSENTDFCFTF
jgi:hypothetical protein